MFKFLVTFLLLNISFAYEINSKLDLLEGSNNWEEGQVRKTKLLIWPIQEVDSKYLKKNLEGKDFLEHFFVSKVISSKFSENNPEAYEIVMNLTLKEYFTKNKIHLWSYKALNIPVTINKDIVINKDPKKLPDFIVLDQNIITPEVKRNMYLISALIGVALVLIVGAFVLINKRREKIRIKEEENNWIKRFKESKTRDDYEFLYKTREKWGTYIDLNIPSVRTLLETIDKHQYKREWDDEILREIDFSHSEIRESI